MLLKKYSQKRATMCGDQWLSSQMINHMVTFMAYFVQMISHCAQGCILEWQTMLPKGVFIFFAWKIHFPFFECPKWGFSVKELPNKCCKNGPNHFAKILGHVWCTIDTMVGCQNPWSTSGEKDKLSPIQLEAGQIWTAGAS